MQLGMEIFGDKVREGQTEMLLNKMAKPKQQINKRGGIEEGASIKIFNYPTRKEVGILIYEGTRMGGNVSRRQILELLMLHL